MQSSFKFCERARDAGLVIVFPPEVSGLFNPEVHGLVQEVEKSLPGLYVTYALSSGESPTVGDAIRAARFVGCDSAVVVLASENGAVWPGDRELRGDWLLASAANRSELEASAVVEAYRSALAAAGKAA